MVSVGVRSGSAYFAPQTGLLKKKPPHKYEQKK
jgi:hypothetical protein